MTIDPGVVLAGQLSLAVLAGLLLNLTPCVLPAIPIKVRSILRESGSQKSHRLLAGFAFLCGTLTLFLTLGTLTALLQWSWGTLFQSTVFVAFLVSVLLGFAAMTWLDIPIPVPQFAAKAHGQRYLEAFIAGLLSAILAAPCAGPFLGGVLAFAVTQPTHVILMLFAGIGVGLALPYVLLMLNPDWLKKLPKAGAWTAAIREFLALILVAAAVFFSASLVSGPVANGLWWVWLGLVAVWCAARFFKGGWPVRFTVTALGILSVTMTLVFASGQQTDMPTKGIAWQPYSAELLDRTREKRRAHLIEFTADWCINCKVLERSVYASPALAAIARDAAIVPIQVDLTQSNPEREQLLGDMGGQALPFAVVIDQQNKVVARFTGLFKENDLIQALQEAGKSL